MGCIYKSANGVIVWLGDSSADSRLALSIMGCESYLGQQVEVHTDRPFLRHPDAEQAEWYAIGLHFHTISKFGESLTTFCADHGSNDSGLCKRLLSAAFPGPQFGNAIGCSNVSSSLPDIVEETSRHCWCNESDTTIAYIY
jgi:hypothetical protein